MLVLTRKVGGSILIGDDIVVTVLGSSEGQTRIGITAPDSIAIDRSEIRKKKDTRAAALNKVKKSKDQFSDFTAQRNNALTTLDMRWARKAMPSASSDEVRLIALHKARYECTQIEPSLRHESRKFLEASKLARMNDMPWPINKQELPE